jgi:SAM-dependent methyltransferase
MKWQSLTKAVWEAPSLIRSAKLAAISQLKAPSAECPICGFQGKFLSFGDPVRTAVQCPQCWSLERHRLLALAVRSGQISFEGKDVLAFAADSATARACAGARHYSTSNYPDANGADHSFNIEGTKQPDNSYDAVVCSHVLEHVNDKKALAELFRILRPGGHLIFMVPLIEGWTGTYEDPSIRSDQERHVHFGQFDHVRYYGADVRQRAVAAGFILNEVTAGPTDSIRYGLHRGEKIFIGQKPLANEKQ